MTTWTNRPVNPTGWTPSDPGPAPTVGEQGFMATTQEEAREAYGAAADDLSNVDDADVLSKGQGAGLARADLSNVTDADLGAKTVTATGGSSARSLAARFGDVLSPLDFGAAGDGAADDYAAMVATFAAALTLGREVDGGGRTYKVNTPIRVTLAGRDLGLRNLKWDLSAVTGTTSVTGFAQKIGLLIAGADLWAVGYATTTLSAPVTRTDRTLPVADSSGFAAGDVVLVHEAATWGAAGGGAKKSEVAYVKSVAAGSLTLAARLQGAYSTAATVRKYADEFAQVRDVEFIGGGAGSSHYGLVAANLRSVDLRGVRTFGCEKVGVSVLNCAELTGDDLNHEGSNLAGYGYGLQYNGTSNVNIGRLTGKNCRHAVTSGPGASGTQMSRNIMFGQVIAHGCSDAGFDAHPGVVDVQVGEIDVTCNPDSSGTGVMFQGAGLQVGSIRVDGFKDSALRLQFFGDGDGIERAYRIDSLYARTADTSAVFVLDYDDSNALAAEGTWPVSSLSIGHLDGVTPRGTRIYAQQQTLRDVQIGLLRSEATNSAYDGLLIRNATPGVIQRAAVVGGVAKAATVGVGRASYVLGDAANSIRANFYGTTFEGGAYGMQALYCDVGLDRERFASNVTGEINLSTGGAVRRRGGAAQTINTDAAFTLTPNTEKTVVHHTGTLTAARAVTLSTTGAYDGASFRIVRTGGGAFNLNVGTGPLKALATNTWAEFAYDGTAAAWRLTASGSL